MIYTLFRGLRAVRRRLAARINGIVYRSSLASVGSGCHFADGVIISQPGKVSLGDRVFFDSRCIIGTELPEGRLIVGNGVQANFDVQIDYSGGLTIGHDTLISARSVIYTHSHGLDPHSIPEGLSKTIGRNVWIGSDCVILQSVREIGDYAVIGSGAVVTRDVPAGAIVGGNPAKVIRIRDDVDLPQQAQ